MYIYTHNSVLHLFYLKYCIICKYHRKQKSASIY